MGSGAKDGLRRMRIRTRERAEAVCSAITAEYMALASNKRENGSGVEYEIDDLVCYACMAGHRELVSCEQCLDLPPATLFAFPSHSELHLSEEKLAEISKLSFLGYNVNPS